MSLTQMSGKFNPTHVSGCAWWLEADRGIAFDTNGHVNSWMDGSGNGRTVSQRASGSGGSLSTNPVYTTSAVNGYPALTFDGTKVLDLRTGSGPLSFLNNKSGATFTAVTWSTSASATQVIFSLSLSSNKARAAGVLQFWVAPGFGGVRLDSDSMSSGSAWKGSTTSVPMTPTVLTGVFNYGGAEIDVYINGTKTAYTSWHTAGSTSATDLAYIIVGTLYQDQTDQGLVGNLALLCGWERCLTAAEIQKLHQFYGQKYGITVTL